MSDFHPDPERVVFMRIPTLEDLKRAERIDGMIVVHLGHYKDYDLAQEKVAALRVLIGLPEDHRLLNRLNIINGEAGHAEMYFEEFREMVKNPESVTPPPPFVFHGSPDSPLMDPIAATCRKTGKKRRCRAYVGMARGKEGFPASLKCSRCESDDVIELNTDEWKYLFFCRSCNFEWTP